MTETTNDREALARQAFHELDALLGLIPKVDREGLEALRGLTMRCHDLLGIVYAGMDESFATTEQMQVTVYGIANPD